MHDLDRTLGPLGQDARRASHGVDRALARQCTGQDPEAVARRGRLLEPLDLRKRVHPRLQRSEQQLRLTVEATAGDVDDRVVFAGGGVPAARTGGHAELGRDAHRTVAGGGPADPPGAAAQGQRRLDRLLDRVRGGSRAQRPEVEAAVGALLAHDGQTGEALRERELQVGVGTPRLGSPVEPRFVLLDEADLTHLGFERMRAHEVVDRLGLAEELRDLAPVVAAEVAAHAGAQVGRLADVDHAAVAVAEQVDAGLAREASRERELARRRVGSHRREREQVVEAEHAVRRGALEQRVQDLERGLRVGERAMHRFGTRPEVSGERGEAQVRDLVADEPARRARRCRHGDGSGARNRVP